MNDFKDFIDTENDEYGLPGQNSYFNYSVKNNDPDTEFESNGYTILIKENTGTSSKTPSKTFEIPITEDADGNKYFCLYTSENLTIKLLGYRV